MKKILLLMTFLSLVSYCYGQCSDGTRELVDSIKMSIPYPKFNIGDTVYIACINNPAVGINQLTEKDIDVYKVRIVEMCVINGHLWGTEGNISGLFIEGSETMEWNYQYLDTTIKNPRYGDFSKKIFPESRFAKTSKEAIQILKKSCKE